MKLAFYILFFVLVLIALIPAVNAGSENMNNLSGLVELPEMDMTGLHTDIPLIEIDPEIMNATLDWIVLVHDEDGKKSLLDDVNRSSVSIAEKTDMKNALETLWDTYPVKSEAIGEKSIEITVQSDGSNRTLSIPIGHVTRISFDRVKMGKDPGDTTIIVLPENINQTIRNISILRVNNTIAIPARESSTFGSDRSSGNPGNSFYSGNSFGSGFSSSSGQTMDSSFPASTGKGGGYPGNGLVAWQGDWNPTYPDTNPLHDTGHHSYIYWACKHLNYAYMNDAAATAMAPDSWTPIEYEAIIFGLDEYLESFANQIWHCWTHFYDPSINVGDAYVKAQYYADISKTNYSSGNYIVAANNLGHASHFMTDVANPMHAGQGVNQIIDYLFTPHDTHAEYETFVSSNWSSNSTYKFGNLVKNNTYYYRVRSPDEATINTATFSHAYVDTLYYHVKNQPGTGFYSDSTVKNITENCVLIAARYTGGLVEYTRENDIDEIPIADFDANPKSGYAPLTVNFIEKSHWYGSEPTWNWSFGDGNFSNLRYPYDHEYLNNGNYTIKLTVSNANGESNKTMIISVVGSPAPVADFNYATVGPSTIHFTDISSNYPTSWVWDFGDGSNASVEQNPTHQYSGGCFRTVRLYASNVYGATLKEEMVLVNNPWPHADFIPSRTSGSNPLIVQFIDNSTNYADNWTWDFGDNSSVSYQRNTSHVYNNPGNYSVVLTASNSYGNSTSTNVILVNSTIEDKIGIYQNGSWYLDWNGNGTFETGIDKTYSFGSPGWPSVLGDWNGDGKTEIGISNGISWYLDYNGNGAWDDGTDKAYTFGTTGWTPVVGDWNQDGTANIGVYQNGVWYLDYNGNGAWDAGTDKEYNLGASGWTPVTGDWNQDGKPEIGIYQNGVWYLDDNGNGAWDAGTDKLYYFGDTGWTSIVGDWNHDGKTDIGITTGQLWYLDMNNDGVYTSEVDKQYSFGESGWTPVLGDWNGDANTKIGVYQNGIWYLDFNGNGTWDAGTDKGYNLGATGWTPIVGKWN